jgi:hypothetical protein
VAWSINDRVGLCKLRGRHLQLLWLTWLLLLLHVELLQLGQ